MTGSILIVDDDPVQRRLLEAAVSRFGYTAVVADGGEAGLRLMDGPGSREVAVVILDLVMPGLDGIGVLKAMRERGIDIPVIVQTAQGGIETVVQAMRHGAFDFVVKPASPDRLSASISHALKVGAVEGEVKRVARRSGGLLTFKDMITHSPAMERVLRLGQKAAASNIPILIEGESGVGKELVARAIQGAGQRRARPFVTVNCGAIPENLVESSCSAMRKARSPALPRSMPANSSKPTPARCSSTRSATCRSTCRSSCCAPCRRARSTPSAAVRRSRSTSG